MILFHWAVALSDDNEILWGIKTILARGQKMARCNPKWKTNKKKFSLKNFPIQTLERDDLRCQPLQQFRLYLVPHL
jgi:hypothetical protein